MRHLVSILVFGAMLAAAALPVDIDAQAADGGRRLALGRITEEPDRNIARLNAMASYLSGALAPDGIEAVDVTIAETPKKMAELLRKGEVDLFSETASTAIALIEAGLAEPLLREWKKGVPEYRSVIFVRTDGGIRSLTDLRGRKFAFEDPGSTSGYLLPRVAMAAAGLSLEELANPRNNAPADAVGYSFANGEINVVAWVNRGLADAGAISNLDWEDPEKSPERLRKDLTVIHETPPVIRSLMMVRSSLDAATKERLSEVLLQMHEHDEGLAAMKSYFGVSRYDAFDESARANLESVGKFWRVAGVKIE